MEKYSDIYSRVIVDREEKKEIVSCKQIIKLNKHYFNKIWHRRRSFIKILNSKSLDEQNFELNFGTDIISISFLLKNI